MSQEKKNDRGKADAIRLFDEVEDYAIFLLDRQGVVQTWNKGAELIKGYRPEEVIGRSHRIFYSKEDIESGLPDRLIREALEKGKTNHEGWRVRQDGGRFWGSTHFTTLHDETGAPSGFIKITKDLTAMKVAEEQAVIRSEQLLESNEDLRKSEE